jgi:glycosyltransferase involved in cell wall biosynthesis
MIIGIDANQANKDEKSGVEWYAWHLIQNLKQVPQTGLEFRLYSSESLNGELSGLPDNWQSRVLGWIKLPFWNMWTQIRLSFELMLHPPDVFFAPGYTLPLVHPKKSVVVIHDLGFEHFPEYYNFLYRLYLKFVTWYSLKAAWKIIVPSEFTKQDIVQKYNYSADKVYVTPLSHDEKLYKVISNDDLISNVLNKYKIKKPYLLFIARLTKKKNILGVIKAFHKLKQSSKHLDLQLVLGGQRQYGWDEASDYIKNNNLSKDIKVLGYVPETDKPILINAAEVFVFPSFFEGFGIPVLEAMACGVPVVTSDTTCLPEVAADASVLVDPHSIDAIAEAIEKILADNDLAQDLSAKGIARAKEFSWHKTTNATLDILK